MARLGWIGVGLCVAACLEALRQWHCQLERPFEAVVEDGHFELRQLSEDSDGSSGLRIQSMVNGSPQGISLVRTTSPRSQYPIGVAALSVCLEAALPELWLKDLREVSLPSRALLRFWTLETVEDIKRLSLRRTAVLIGPCDTYSDFVASQLDVAYLEDALAFPTEADVDRLWWSANTRRLFENALRARYCLETVERAIESRLALLKMRIASPQQFSCVWETDSFLGELDRLRSRLKESECASWEALWESDRMSYPHWSFLMRVASRRFL